MKIFHPRLSIFLLLGIFAVLSVASCSRDNSRSRLKLGRILMGTLVEITAVGDQGQLKESVEAAFSEIRRIEDLTSFHKDSELNKINENAGSSPTVVDPELVSLIQTSLVLSERTGGAFDPTIGALTRIWNFSGTQGPCLPEQSEIELAREKVNWRKVEVFPERHEVFLPEKGMALDLGGIVKGYALKKAGELLKSRGIKAALLNAGGDIIAFGGKNEKTPWKIGIQNPRDNNRIDAVVEIESGAVFTSGDYERFLEKDGKRYHHVLDPFTGYPASGFESVTIVAPDGIRAEGFSAAVFVLGPEKSKLFLENNPDISCLTVDPSGKIEVFPRDCSTFQLQN